MPRDTTLEKKTWSPVYNIGVEKMLGNIPDIRALRHISWHNPNLAQPKPGTTQPLLCYGGSLWQEGSLRDLCVGGSFFTVVAPWLAFPRRHFQGVVRW